MSRSADRKTNQLRPIKLTPDYILYPEGSILIEVGKTKVLCNATIQEEVPAWIKQQGLNQGWVTAEYGLLPRSTHKRISRESGSSGSRSQEIKRLIGRALRASVDLKQLAPYTCVVDCDVLQADGGTRTAAITAGYIAMAKAFNQLISANKLPAAVLIDQIAAVSVGIVDGQSMLDLDYQEDSRATTDLNVVMNARGEYIELQGTAEGEPFSQDQLQELLVFARNGIRELMLIQKQYY